MRRRLWFAVAVAAVLAVAVSGWAAAAGGESDVTVAACLSGGKLTNVQVTRTPSCAASATPVQWAGQAAVSPGPTPTPSPTATSPAPTPSPTATGSACVAQIGGGCRYQWDGWPGSNGYNTYVIDQAINVTSGGTGQVTATSPSSWSATGNYNPCGGCVQTFTAVQQLTNNWGTGGWNGSSDTPLSALTSLTITYNESSPSGAGDQYEFSPDIWTSYSGHLCGGCGDVMMWADTSSQRCGAVDGWPVLGHPVIDGQNWTAYLGPGGAGDEIILVLDGAGGPGTCAQQSAGTLDVYAALQWLSANPGASGFPAMSGLTMSSLNIGWEITDAAGGTYSVNGLKFNVATS